MKTMLVPLDGSPLSETVLPVVIVLADQGRYRVTLLSVWEVLPQETADVGEEHVGELRNQGVKYFRAYLDNVARALSLEGIEVNIEVRSGHPAAQIMALSAELEPDLIAMASRGRGATSYGRRGSVADKVLRGSVIPVLVLGPRTLEAWPPGEVKVRSVLVPLDGSAESEAALPIAAELARQVGARATLFRVVPPLLGRTWAELREGYPTEIDNKRLRSAVRYLKALQAEFPDVATEVCVQCGYPREEIPRLIESGRYDLVVMASRSRYSPGRWTLGGVADIVIDSAAPVVLVPPIPRQ